MHGGKYGSAVVQVDCDQHVLVPGRIGAIQRTCGGESTTEGLNRTSSISSYEFVVNYQGDLKESALSDIENSGCRLNIPR